MIAVDTNILVYAHRVDSPWHVRAAECLRNLAEGPAPWMIPWPCLHEFWAIVTHPRIYDPPTPIEDAIRQIEYWIEAPNLVLGSEAPMHWSTLKQLLVHSSCVGPMVHDARVAAICLEHGVATLWSADRDFSKLLPQHVENPLTA